MLRIMSLRSRVVSTRSFIRMFQITIVRGVTGFVAMGADSEHLLAARTGQLMVRQSKEGSLLGSVEFILGVFILPRVVFESSK